MSDPQLVKCREKFLVGVAKDFTIFETHMFRYKDHIYVLMDVDIKREILDILIPLHNCYTHAPRRCIGIGNLYIGGQG